MALTVPEGAPTKTVVYTDLLGVDFSQDASLVDRQHSPDMVNMISDEGGSPVKRKGWEILNELGHEIVDLCHFESDGHEYYLVVYKDNYERLGVIHEGYFLIQYFPETNTFGQRYLLGDIKPTNGFFFNDKYYIPDPDFTPATFIMCEPNEGTLSYSLMSAKIPTVLISRNPSTGGGVAYEDINLLSPFRTEQFADPSGTAKKFLLGSTQDASNPQLKYLDSDGEWKTDNTATLTTSGGQYWCNITTAHPFYASAGADNIKITYYSNSGNEDKAKRIIQCTNHAFFSHGGLDQIFVTGNPKYPNYVWYSNYGDPSYFPDLNYIIVGNAGTNCMGFLNIGENLAVIKEQSDEDSSIFFIYETSITSKTVSTNTSNGSESETTQEYAYAIKRASSGVGAISKRCFGILQDEPLFLSRNGVYGLVSMNTTTEKAVRNRSRHVDRKLLSEAHLEKAISCVCNGYYYIFINGHVYILDSRHVASDKRGNTNYAYEAYYWDNVPAKCVCVANGVIYFGTEDGKLCRFKNTDQMTDYSDGSHYDAEQQKQVGGVAIPAVYCTRNDDDSAPQYFKTMMKKGSMITVAPFANSSVEVYLRADSSSRKSITDGEITVSSITTVGSMPMLSTTLTDTNLTLDWEEGTALGGKYTAALVNSGIQYVGSWIAEEGELFTNVDFDHLVFDMRSGPRDFFFRKKKKKYVRLQFIFVNNEINEGFGIYNIVKTYSLTRYAK